MKSDNVEELFPFYALGTATEEERARVESYVAGDPDAKSRLEEMIVSASVLAYVPEPLDPSSEMKERLLARARAERPPEELPQEMREPRRRWMPALVGLGSLAAAIAFVILAGAQMSALRTELAELESVVLAQQELIAGLAGPGVVAVDISGTEFQPGARGRLYADPSEREAVLIVSELADPEFGSSYQVWLIAGPELVSAGLLELDPAGLTIHLIDASSALRTFDALGISIEPIGGSLLPTGDIVMLSELSY